MFDGFFLCENNDGVGMGMGTGWDGDKVATSSPYQSSIATTELVRAHSDNGWSFPTRDTYEVLPLWMEMEAAPVENFFRYWVIVPNRQI